MLKLSRPPHRWLFVAAVAVALSGCNQKGQNGISPVSGTITLDGEPVAGAKVMFVPDKYRDAETDKLPYSYATTDENGRYNLRLENGKRGAVVGKHTVFISTAESVIAESGDVKSKDRLENMDDQTAQDPQQPNSDQPQKDVSKKSDEPKNGVLQPDDSEAAEQESTKPNDALPSIALTDSNDHVIDIHGRELVENTWRKRIVQKGETLQSKYNTNSTLEFTVKAGTSNQANFKLSKYPD